MMFRWAKAFFERRRIQKVAASYHRVTDEWRKR